MLDGLGFSRAVDIVANCLVPIRNNLKKFP